MTVLIAVFVAGGLGALTRYVVDALVVARWQRWTSGTWADFPASTFLINVTGAGVLGVVTGYATAHGGSAPDHLLTIVGTGYLGAYTTFSTEEWQTLGLLRRDGAVVAVSVVGSLAASLLLAGLGLWIGARL